MFLKPPPIIPPGPTILLLIVITLKMTYDKSKPTSSS